MNKDSKNRTREKGKNDYKKGLQKKKEERRKKGRNVHIRLEKRKCLLSMKMLQELMVLLLVLNQELIF